MGFSLTHSYTRKRRERERWWWTRTIQIVEWFFSRSTPMYFDSFILRCFRPILRYFYCLIHVTRSDTALSHSRMNMNIEHKLHSLHISTISFQFCNKTIIDFVSLDGSLRTLAFLFFLFDFFLFFRCFVCSSSHWIWWKSEFLFNYKL